MTIQNLKVYGLDNAIRGSKLPMSTAPEALTAELTDTVRTLGKSPTGSGHDQFLTGIVAQFDLTFTVKAWAEMERYHFMDFISSQSTMHRLAGFDFEKSYIEHVDPIIIERMKILQRRYNEMPDGEGKREMYLRLLYSNPCGFKLTAAMTTNYRQLKTIYFQRKNHRLPEWREFCEEVENFPLFRELVIGGSHDD